MHFVNDPPRLTKGVFGKLSMFDLAKEPSLFSCGEFGLYEHGGALAKSALSQVLSLYKDEYEHAKKAGLSAIIDVRVQRLMPGMYPSIPGWHCDAVPRNGYHGQPDFGLIDPSAFHVALLLSSEVAGVSNTEFVTSRLRPTIMDKDHVYRDLHTQVERAKPDTIKVADGVFTYFTPKTIHRACPTARRGWRMFFRFSMYHKPPIQNVISGQQQVYLLSEENGW